MLIAFMCSIRLSSLDALSVTAICMLIYDPYLVFNIGFQFSFVGSFALLLSAPLLLESSNGIIRNSIYISIISQLVSTPILLYHFGYFSPYSILLNLLYVPFYLSLYYHVALLFYCVCQLSVSRKRICRCIINKYV